MLSERTTLILNDLSGRSSRQIVIEIGQLKLTLYNLYKTCTSDGERCLLEVEHYNIYNWGTVLCRLGMLGEQTTLIFNFLSGQSSRQFLIEIGLLKLTLNNVLQKLALPTARRVDWRSTTTQCGVLGDNAMLLVRLGD